MTQQELEAIKRRHACVYDNHADNAALIAEVERLRDAEQFLCEGLRAIIVLAESDSPNSCLKPIAGLARKSLEWKPKTGAFTMVSVLWFTALAAVTAGLIFFHYLRELAL